MLVQDKGSYIRTERSGKWRAVEACIKYAGRKRSLFPDGGIIWTIVIMINALSIDFSMDFYFFSQNFTILADLSCCSDGRESPPKATSAPADAGGRRFLRKACSLCYRHDNNLGDHIQGKVLRLCLHSGRT